MIRPQSLYELTELHYNQRMLIILMNACVCCLVHERERESLLTPIVDVGLKPILMFMISPFDIPPCLSAETISRTADA